MPLLEPSPPEQGFRNILWYDFFCLFLCMLSWTIGPVVADEAGHSQDHSDALSLQDLNSVLGHSSLLLKYMLEMTLPPYLL